MGQDISALGSLGALRQGQDQTRLTATQQAEQAHVRAVVPQIPAPRADLAFAGLVRFSTLGNEFFWGLPPRLPCIPNVGGLAVLARLLGRGIF